MNVRELAHFCGVSCAAVYQWIKREGWPFGRGPFDGDAVQAWRAGTLADDPGAPYREAAKDAGGDYPLITPTGVPEVDRELRKMPPMTQAKMRALLERGSKLALENALTQRGLVERAVVEKDWASRAAVVRASLLAAPRQLAADLEGKPRAEIESILDTAMRAICNRYAGE